MYLSFADMLLESSIKAILKREFPDIRFVMSEYPKEKYAVLQVVLVQYDQRKQGKATEFMKRLIELADQYEMDIFLTPDDGYSGKGDMNKSQLTKWYKKLGFKKKDKSDFRAMQSMVYYAK